MIILKNKEFKKIFKGYGHITITLEYKEGDDRSLPNNFIRFPEAELQGMKEGEERKVKGVLYSYQIDHDPYEPVEWEYYWVVVKKEQGVIHITDIELIPRSSYFSN